MTSSHFGASSRASDTDIAPLPPAAAAETFGVIEATVTSFEFFVTPRTAPPDRMGGAGRRQLSRAECRGVRVGRGGLTCGRQARTCGRSSYTCGDCRGHCPDCWDALHEQTPHECSRHRARRLG